MKSGFTNILSVLICLIGIAAPGLSLASAKLDRQTIQCRDMYQKSDFDTAIEPGVIVPASSDTPAHCRVRGVIDGSIGFQVSMPLEDWSQRFLFHAGGGLVGAIGDTSSLLSRGFAMATSDAGHTNHNSSAFARDKATLINFGYRANHLSALLAKSLIEDFYGSAIDYSYIWGCSNGGRAALVEALRYPGEFDGVISGAPALKWGEEMQPWGLGAHRQQTRHPLTVESLAHLDANSRRACDLLDGVVDGVIGDPRKCTLDMLKLDQLACRGGQETACLSPGQLETARYIYEGIKDKEGRVLSPGVYPGAEAAGDWMFWVTGNPQFNLGPAHETMGNMMGDVMHRQPGFDITDFDVISDRATLAAMTVAVDAPSPDFSQLRENGVKLLFYNGWNDMPCRARALENYMSEAEQLNGSFADMADYMRLFMVPGMLHCAAGPGAWVANYIDTMVEWVEQGRAPDRIVAHQPGIVDWLEAMSIPGAKQVDSVDVFLRAGAAKEGAATFTRPLCPYPQYANYRGTGDQDDERSFDCVAD